LENIRQSGALFIRKVAYVIDPNLHRILPVDDPGQIPPIGWPKEVKLSPVPDWEKKLAELKKRKQQELEQKQKKDATNNEKSTVNGEIGSNYDTEQEESSNDAFVEANEEKDVVL
jgi:hypothetical protein